MMTRRTKTYLDNNAFQRLSSPGIDLPAALTATGTVLMLGTHVVYELARWFLSPLGYEGAPPLFRVLANLADIDLLDYVPTTDRLIRAEFDRASTGVHIVTVVHPLNKAAFKLELHRLARADTVDAQTFIAKREARRAESQQRSLELIIKASHKLQESRPDAWRRLRAFDAFREFARARDTDYLRQLAAMHRCRTSPAAIRRILDRPESSRSYLLGWSPRSI